LYRFYNSSQNSKLFVDFCEINELSLIIGQGGVINIHIDTNFTPSKHVSVLQIKNKKYNWLKFYYYYLKNKLSSFATNGSTIQWLNKKNILSFKIKLPKNKKLIDDLNPMFQEIEEHQQAVKDADELYKKYIQELSNEAIPKP
jgi:restriction endonuclease S subunit